MTAAELITFAAIVLVCVGGAPVLVWVEDLREGHKGRLTMKRFSLVFRLRCLIWRWQYNRNERKRERLTWR